MKNQVETLIETLYQKFSKYRISSPLTVCRCPACVGPETERALISTSLKQLSAGLLSEFTNSAMAGSEIEMKYFLPRYFELLFAGEQTSSIGFELSLDRLGQFDWKQWPKAERAIVDEALALLVHEAVVAGGTLSKIDLEALLVLIARAGGKPAPILLQEFTVGDEGVRTRIAGLGDRIREDRMTNEFWPTNKIESREVRKLLGDWDLDIGALIKG